MVNTNTYNLITAHLIQDTKLVYNIIEIIFIFHVWRQEVIAKGIRHIITEKESMSEVVDYSIRLSSLPT